MTCSNSGSLTFFFFSFLFSLLAANQTQTYKAFCFVPEQSQRSILSISPRFLFHKEEVQKKAKSAQKRYKTLKDFTHEDRASTFFLPCSLWYRYSLSVSSGFSVLSPLLHLLHVGYTTKMCVRISCVPRRHGLSPLSPHSFERMLSRHRHMQHTHQEHLVAFGSVLLFLERESLTVDLSRRQDECFHSHTHEEILSALCEGMREKRVTHSCSWGATLLIFFLLFTCISLSCPSPHFLCVGCFVELVGESTDSYTPLPHHSRSTTDHQQAWTQDERTPCFVIHLIRDRIHSFLVWKAGWCLLANISSRSHLSSSWWHNFVVVVSRYLLLTHRLRLPSHLYDKSTLCDILTSLNNDSCKLRSS